MWHIYGFFWGAFRGDKSRWPEVENVLGDQVNPQSRRPRCVKVCDRFFLRLFNSNTEEEDYSGFTAQEEDE